MAVSMASSSLKHSLNCGILYVSNVLEDILEMYEIYKYFQLNRSFLHHTISAKVVSLK